jgi:DnaJ-class molecular chaperone
MSSTSNTIVRVACADCDGQGTVEAYTYSPWQVGPTQTCGWCDGRGYIDYEEIYDSIEDAKADYPDSIGIFFKEEE